MDQISVAPSVQLTPSACITDITAPTFAGISGIVANADGSGTGSWSAASDATLPIRYDVYIQATTATGLFSSANLVLSTKSTSIRLFYLTNLTMLQAGTTYHVGVRAIDGVGNSESNTASLSFVSSGVLAGAVTYEPHGVFSLTDTDLFQGFLWITGDGQRLTTLLGTASYVVYDEDEVAVPGVTQTGITANADGVYVLTPVSSSSLIAFTHYRVRIQVVRDSITYTSYRGFTVGE